MFDLLWSLLGFLVSFIIFNVVGVYGRKTSENPSEYMYVILPVGLIAFMTLQLIAWFVR